MNRILLVDDHPISRDGIAGLIERHDDLEVCGEAGSTAEALELIGKLKPDLVLTDINLPDRSGLELLKDVRALNPKQLFIVLSMHDETIYAERVLQAGGRGYLMKETEPANVVKAIRAVLNGGVYISESMSSRLLTRMAASRGKATLSPLGSLSDRELEVFQLIGEGKVGREIAEKMGISPRTVEAHRGHIKEKLKIGSGVDLTRYALKWIETGGLND